MSVCLKRKISVTAETIGLYSSGNKPTDPVVVLCYVIKELENPQPLQKRKIAPTNKIIFSFFYLRN